MCLAVPLKLIKKDGVQGMGEFDGVRRSIRLDFVPDAVPGDDVLVHAGFAIAMVDHNQAEADRALFREVIQAAQ